MSIRPAIAHRTPQRVERVVAAPDKFKGTVSAQTVAEAIGHACWELGIECVEVHFPRREPK